MSACCALLAGCGGGGERQDADEPTGTFELEVVEAQFPQSQTIAGDEQLRIAVRNTGERTVPNVAVSLEGLTRTDEMPGLQDPTRPVFIIEDAPADGDTAYVQTWALGRLAPNETKAFSWRLSPVVPGTHTVSYTVAAGLDGKAKAVAEGGGPPTGKITVRVSEVPAEEDVDPGSGDVEAVQQ